ncbi:MAG: hypothetical protein ACI90V_006669 [Bacillariaceae sp.]|jgi:hypothetical protein
MCVLLHIIWPRLSDILASTVSITIYHLLLHAFYYYYDIIACYTMQCIVATNMDIPHVQNHNSISSTTRIMGSTGNVMKMDNCIELTLQSIRGIRYGNGNGISKDDVSGIKAYVSFSGSVPNMKVSSFAMCPKRGSLVVESNTPELDEEAGSNPAKKKILSITFNDPLEEKRTSQRLPSSNSSSSETSSTSYQPHLQFDLQKGNNVDTHKSETETETEAEAEAQRTSNNYQHNKIIKLHITIRSVDDNVIEGVSDLTIPDNIINDFPLTLDLPIKKNKSKNNYEQPQIYFEDDAYIRVHLNDTLKHLHGLPSESNASQEFVLSDNVDEIQLGGMVKKIHEQEEMGKARVKAIKVNLFKEGKGAKRFSCNGPVDIKHSFIAFLDGIRGLRTKCVDPEEELLFTGITMASTIDTRDSLKI